MGLVSNLYESEASMNRVVEGIRDGICECLRGLSPKDYTEVLEGVAEVVDSLRLVPDETKENP